MFEPYSNQGTQMWGHGGSPHAPTLGVLADFLTQEVGLCPLCPVDIFYHLIAIRGIFILKHPVNINI